MTGRVKLKLDAFSVFAGAGVDFDLVALSHKNWHTQVKPGGNLGGLENFAGRIAFDGRFGPGYFAHNAGGHFNRNGFVVIKHDFEFHAVFEVVQRVAHVFSFDFVLVKFGVHADVHRFGKVRVGALFFIQNDLVELVVRLEHDFGTEVGDQAFELHAHGGGVAAAAAVFSLEHDHRVFSVHDDIAGANFLSGFHSDYVKVGRLLSGEGGMDWTNPVKFRKSSILMVFYVNWMICVTRSARCSCWARAAVTVCCHCARESAGKAAWLTPFQT